ncbi:hypothetical protein P6F26_17295 [Roseibacterium sp. SDUM158017]|uniref:hypothetical protein n=1 Tax=Roseicyclus salinarum TaxID=3036773 RepID=UPI0024155322|nr:hypothetical protein [Roseibacterium sp. SDUM158017]MDG4650206.1 hypothetical protein [Roseibacterium sp. SDUM158017]
MGSNSATMRTDAQRGQQGAGQGLWAPVLAGWAFCALPALVALWLDGGDLRLGTDDAMRLVQVRDLMAGQGWFDPVQPRLGPEGGTAMHWSRLVDLPIAALIALFGPLAGQPGAERAAAILWPVLVLLPAVLVMAAAARRLGGRDAAWAAALLTGAAMAHAGKHDPGALDHHNVQLTLLAVVIAGLALAPRSPRWAALAGAAAALSLGVGIERAPVLAAFGAAFALAWVAAPSRLSRSATAFGLSLSGMLAAVFVATAPAMAYAGGYCDALSRDMALPVLSGGLGLAAMGAALSGRAAPVRIGALACVAAVALGMTALVAPACFSNPVDQIDPFLREAWLDKVAETRTLSEALAQIPEYIVPAWLAGAAGLVAAISLMLRGARDRPGWAIVAAGLISAGAIAAYQMRATSSLPVFAILPVSVLAAALFHENLARGRRACGLAAIALVAVSVPGASVPIVASFPTRAAPGSEGAPSEAAILADLRTCYAPGTYRALAARPPGVVSASSNLGAHILLESPHRVLSAPYHRNEAGMIAQLRIARAEPAEAERLLRRHGVDYVAICDGDPETRLPPGSAHPGLYPALLRGEVPAYLARLPVSPESPLRLYAVLPD